MLSSDFFFFFLQIVYLHTENCLLKEILAREGNIMQPRYCFIIFFWQFDTSNSYLFHYLPHPILTLKIMLQSWGKLGTILCSLFLSYIFYHQCFIQRLELGEGDYMCSVSAASLARLLPDTIGMKYNKLIQECRWLFPFLSNHVCVKGHYIFVGGWSWVHGNPSWGHRYPAFCFISSEPPHM